MEKIVYKYNNTIHKSLFNRFTPNEAQHNSMIEHVFIMEKTLELEEVKEAISYTHNYNPGDILLCHILTKECIHAKRRRNFDTLAIFINYEHGNTLVQLYNTTQEIVLPIYCTKFLCKSIERLNTDEKRTFL
jgi:predicted metal-binding protein